MLRSKSRSGSIDFGNKSHSSIFSKTISASKLCRGDVLVSQIDSNALVSVDKKHSKGPILSEKQINRVVSMQEQMGGVEEELRRTKEQLVVVMEERNKSVDEVREMKEAARKAEKKASGSLSPEKAAELHAEVRSLRELLSNSQQELKAKDDKMERLELEVKRGKELELKLAERDSLLDSLREELKNAKDFEARSSSLLADNKKIIQELEAEIERGKMSEMNMFQSLEHQTKQLEEAKIELEESKMEVSSLRKKVELFHASSGGSKENARPRNEEIVKLESQLQLAKEHLARAQESEKIVMLKADSLQNELGLVKSELKLAIEAEERSKNAMDEFALALKELATEANQAKEKLHNTELELEQIKGESEQLKVMLLSMEKRCEKILDEAKKETELHKNTSERLRLEAEESLFAWNGKEMGFVSCIKRAEEERAFAQHEIAKLTDSIKVSEHAIMAAREENHKLRDILKQAINEANAAKAAAGIARDENSHLKDILAEKDEALHFLTKDNEQLRINEAAAHEKIKEFKHLLAAASMGLISDSKAPSMLNSPSETDEEDVKEENIQNNSNSGFNLEEFKLINDDDNTEETEKHEDPAKAEALKGSIFDADASPKSEAQTPKPVVHHQRGPSCPLSENGGTTNPEEQDIIEGGHCDEAESERNGHRRRRSLYRRVGDILMRKSFHRKELSTEQPQ